jgi:hypothetical protein
VLKVEVLADAVAVANASAAILAAEAPAAASVCVESRNLT